MREPTLRWTALAVSLLVAALAGAPPVSAHAVLARSTPARRAALSEPPSRIQLWFSEPVEPRFSRATVVDGAGQRVDRGDAGMAPEDPRELRLALPPLPPGSYRILYRVLSVDGHVVEGVVPFTVRASR